MGFLSNDQLTFIFGLLGNIVAVGMFLAPVPTFYTIFKRKSSEGFQSIPYSVALMSASLLLYYGLLKTNASLLISINSIGCAFEATYLIIHLIYAPKQERMHTMKLLLIFNMGSFGSMLLVTMLLVKGSNRLSVVGWICAVFSVAVCAAPLSVMRRVIRTKSVEYLPFTLSASLTLNAVMWFFYGLLQHDYYIALPNVLGFLFGIAQMILYMVFKNPKNNGEEKEEQVAGNKEVVEMTNENESCSVDDPDKETKISTCCFKPKKSNANKKIEVICTNV
ncbi:bidirectional sugar transporter [Salix suchowensis]|nr:bidirectional sugar transporter [Salix suchowensis]